MLGDIGGTLLDTFKPVLHIGGYGYIGRNGRIGISHDFGFGKGDSDDLHTTGGDGLHLDALTMLDLQAAAWCQWL